MTYFKCLTWIQYLQVLFIFLSIQVSEYHCLDLTVTWLIVTYLMGSLRCTYKFPGKYRKKTSNKGPGIENAFSFCINSSDVIYFKVTIMGSVPPVFFLLFLTYWQPVAGWFFFFQCIIDQVNCTTEQCRGFFSEYWHVLASQQLFMINYNWFPTIIFRFLKLVFKGTQNQYFLKF